MQLTDEQRQTVDETLKILRSRDRHKIVNAMTKLRSFGDDIKPYLNYLLRSGKNTHGPLTVMEAFRDEWAARVLYDVLETAHSHKLAQFAWNTLRTMGKLPKEWRAKKFDQDLWEKCRTKPSELPAKTEDGWKPIIKWNLLFKLLEDDPYLTNEIIDEFGYIGAEATPSLISALEEGDDDLSQVALMMLAQVGDNRAVDAVQTLTTSDNPTLQSLAQTAHEAVSQRPYEPKPTKPRPAPPSPETLAKHREWVQQMRSPTLSGKFEPDLERRFVRALLRTSTPDADEKIAGWKEFERLGNDALPLLRYYEQFGTPAQQRQAKSVLKSNF